MKESCSEAVSWYESDGGGRASEEGAGSDVEGVSESRAAHSASELPSGYVSGPASVSAG